MRIASFNVNGVNGRLPCCSTGWRKPNPMSVCLQELKAPDEQVPA